MVEDIEKRKASQRKYAESEKGKSTKRRNYLENREKYDKKSAEWDRKNPEKRNARCRKYYNTSKGKLNMLKKHDARRLGIKSTLTLEEFEKVIKRDQECVFCGKEIINEEFDHINPFKPFSKDNIVRCCRDCNRGKSRADMIQWMNYQGYKISEKLKEIYKKAYNL